jgi:hypothetical protein
VLFSFDATDGNIHGVMASGGLAADGLVFELSPLPSGGSCPTGSNPGNGWCQAVTVTLVTPSSEPYGASYGDLER